MPKSKYADKSVAELEKQHAAVSEKIDALRAEKREIAQALDSANAADAAAARIEAMSDTEKAAMAQALKAEGVKPASAAGTPGGK